MERLIHFDLGPGYDWDEAVVEIEWDSSFVWIDIGECWKHSQPSPLARWFCRFNELTHVKYEPATRTLAIVTNANEVLRCVIEDEHPAAGGAESFVSLWKRRD